MVTATAGADRASANAPRCAGADAVPTAATVGQARKATLCLLNNERRLHHLPLLRDNGSLDHSATRYANTLVVHRFFAHETPGGQQLATRLARYEHGYRSWAVGENLAWGSGSDATPRAIVAAWMRSPGHRRNILDHDFRDVGVGIRIGLPLHGQGSGATYVTHHGLRTR